MNSVSNPHDRYFKKAMSYLTVAQDFFQHHLPKYILEVTDLSTLKLQKESHVDSNLSQLMSDVLYRVDINQEPGYLYILVEHQSTLDRLMPFRMFQYAMRIMANHLNKSPKENLPIVVPLVFYHGKKNHRYSTDIFKLFGKSEVLARSVLLKPYTFIDVNLIPDDELKQHKWAGVFELIQKHIFKTDLLNYFEEIMPLLQRLLQKEGEDYIIATLAYMTQRGQIKDRGAFFKKAEELSQTVGGKMKTIAQQLREEGKLEGLKLGIQEGRQEGKGQAAKEIAEKMIIRGLDPTFVNELTGLSLEELLGSAHNDNDINL